MKRREIEATGTIDSNGRLKMYMDELNAFCAEHKGERIIARFFVAPVGSSEALKGYYMNYVVPKVRDGLKQTGDRRTLESTELFLRTMSPTCRQEDGYIQDGHIGYNVRVREINELSNAELIEHVETVRQFAAEELSVIIDDPRTI